MPMHNWKRVPPTIYHNFHQQWTIAICNALNAGMMPPEYSALVEQYSSGLYPDVLAVQRRNQNPPRSGRTITTLEPPRTRMTVRPREARFHERANRVVVRHHLGDVVCVIEVVSPGNKAGKIAVREFVATAVDFLRRGVNLLVVDPFPPGASDPQTLHKLIWDEFDEGVPFELPEMSRFFWPLIARRPRWWNLPRRHLSNRSAWGPSYRICLPGWTPICTLTCRSSERTQRRGTCARPTFDTSSSMARFRMKTRPRDENIGVVQK